MQRNEDEMEKRSISSEETGAWAARDAPVQLQLDKSYFKKGPTLRQTAVETIIIAILALLVALGVKQYALQTFSIPSGSMEKTLLIGDRVVVNKLAYRWGDVKRGDVVVIHRPPDLIADAKIQDLIKRVIGVPGDVIQGGPNGTVELNGHLLNEPYIWDESGAPKTEWTPGKSITLGPNQYFLMGDHRRVSEDGRVFGPIDGSLIEGKAEFRFWPVDRIGGL